jgi:hypothetical protein
VESVYILVHVAIFLFYFHLRATILVLLYLGPAHDCGYSTIQLNKDHLILSYHVYQHLLHFVIYSEYITLQKEEGVLHALGHEHPLSETVSVSFLLYVFLVLYMYE